MDKIAIKSYIRITTQNLLILNDLQLTDVQRDIVEKSIINLELAKMELNKWLQQMNLELYSAMIL